MLLGRRSECRTIDRLLSDARRGNGAALAVKGEPGIGKSELLHYATKRAVGTTVLSAHGVEAESHLAFAGLSDLLRPIAGYLDSIPPPQAAALASVLALGPPVSGDRFTAFVGASSLLAEASEHTPLLAVVDDFHWLDASSREALLFVARRLETGPVVFLFALRSDERIPGDIAGLMQLELGGLDRESAAALLARTAGLTVAPWVAERLFTATAGNPLALLELAALMTPAQLGGDEPFEDPLPAGASVERAFLRQAETLTEQTRRALLVAAASDSGELVWLAQALHRLGLDLDALEQAEEAGLVIIERGALRFRHPLLRSALYQASPAPERRAAHRALADALRGTRTADRRAWHLAAAAAAPDEKVARALEEAAASARKRGDRTAAASAFDRAARLTPDAEDRARRRLEAARELALSARFDRVEELLDDALAETSDPLRRADIQHLRGQVAMFVASAPRAYELLVAEATRIESLAPEKAALMLADATTPCTMAGEIATGLATARRAHALAEGRGGPVELAANMLLGLTLVLSGESGTGYPLVAPCRNLLESDDLLAFEKLLVTAGFVAICVEDYVGARALLDGVVGAARAASALGPLPFALAVLAELDYRTGRWPEAYIEAAESTQLAEDTGQSNELSFSLVRLGRIEAAQGKEDACRQHVERARALAGRVGVDSILTHAAAALGLLELGLGNTEEAIVQLEAVAHLIEGHGLREPAVVQWAPDLVEAYVRAGHAERAERALDRFEREARHTSGNWALAAAARCRGLLADSGEFEREFDHALALHEQTPTPFEQARTEFCYGERLRRARRPSEARERLSPALDTFERLGADPWAARSRDELRASGGKRRAAPAPRSALLTPQEFRVASLVSEGATNREAATALFLSHKTVEAHLGKIYRKLGVRSRTELVQVLLRDQASPRTTA